MQRNLGYVAVTVAIFLVGSAIAVWSYQIQKTELLDDARHDLDLARRVFSFELNMIFEPAPVLYETLIDAGFPEKKDPQFAETFFGLVTGAVRNMDQLDGAFIGFPDGRFYHVQDMLYSGGHQPSGRGNLPTKHIIRRVIESPETDTIGKWFMQASGSKKWSPFEMTTKPYDPRTRIWYKLALDHEFGTWTDPYTFASSGKLGITFARPIYTQSGQLWAVMGIDLSLEALSQTLVRAGNAMARLGDIIFATDFSNRILAHRDSEQGIDTTEQHGRKLAETLANRVTKTDTVENIMLDGTQYQATRLTLNPSTTIPLRVYLARNTDTILKAASKDLYHDVALIFAGSIIVSLILFYAAKLRVEVSAREKAEEDLIAARDAAEAATRAKSIFLATMSHEIRTPMNGVMSMAELLETTSLDTEQRRMSRVIHNSANALLTIINDILDFSKIEAGKLDIESVELSLMDVVDGAAELLAPKVEEKDITILVDIDTELADIRLGDPVRLRQVLLNLGSNAVKFTETGHVILRVFATAPGAERIRFEVEDTGIGLTEDQLVTLFQPFTQAESSTTRKYGGTGLGLSICKRLVEMMDGEISANSVKSKGSTFWFELPLPPAQNTAPVPDYDLSDLQVIVVGLDPALEALTIRYLQAGGITQITTSDDLQAHYNSSHLSHTLLLIDSKVAFNCLRFPSTPDLTIGLIGPRILLQELPDSIAAVSAQKIMWPVSRSKIWHIAAIATGQLDPDKAEISGRADLDFIPPDYATAADNGVLILVAEDNPTNQTVIRKMLDRMGFACEIHNDGQEALNAYRPDEHGLILTDINMPRMSGYELTLALRSQEAATDQHVPIYALTADALSGTERDCLAAGMDGYLTKPIDSRKLGILLADTLPAALPLRQLRPTKPAPSSARETVTEPQDTNNNPSGNIIVDWDREILNPDTIIEIFGTLNTEAHTFIKDASDSWDAKINTLQAALADDDTKTARAQAHILKGAALSIGAERLGRIASDIQDALDASDTEMANIMAPLLSSTLSELRELLPQIFAKYIEK